MASTIGNMVVSQKANESVGKSATTGSGSMSALYGVGGNYEELVRQAAQASYSVSAGDQFAGMANWDLALSQQAFIGGLQDEFGTRANEMLAASRAQDQALKQQIGAQFASQANVSLAGQRAEHQAAAVARQSAMARQAIAVSTQNTRGGWTADDIEFVYGITSQKSTPLKLSGGHISSTFTSLPLQNRIASTDVRGDFDSYGNSTAGRAQFNLANLGAVSYSISVGAYLGVGGEVEMSFNGIAPNEVRFGVGLGLGAHGYLKSAGASAQGFSSAFISKGESNLNVGDYRIGASLGANALFGPVSLQLGALGGGGYSNITQTPKTGSYAYFKSGAALTPSLGIGLEIKANVIEFDYKWR